MDDVALAAGAVVEDGLGQVLGRNGNLFAALQVRDFASGYGIRHSLADLSLEAAQETLPVDGATLFLPDRRRSTSWLMALPRQDAFLARRYHSASSLTCLSV